MCGSKLCTELLVLFYSHSFANFITNWYQSAISILGQLYKKIMATTKFDLQKFDGRINFGIWKVRLIVVLVQQNLKATLDVKEKIPLRMEEQEWNDIDQEALSIIQLSTTDDVLQEVISHTTTVELLNKLEPLYMKKTLANRLRALQKLYMLCMHEGTSITTYISEFTSLVMDLKNMDEMFSDEQQAMMLLCSLPPSY